MWVQKCDLCGEEKRLRNFAIRSKWKKNISVGKTMGGKK